MARLASSSLCNVTAGRIRPLLHPRLTQRSALPAPIGPRLTARTAASVRSFTCSFWKIFEMWLRTVCSEMFSRLRSRCWPCPRDQFEDFDSRVGSGWRRGRPRNLPSRSGCSMRELGQRRSAGIGSRRLPSWYRRTVSAVRWNRCLGQVAAGARTARHRGQIRTKSSDDDLLLALQLRKRWRIGACPGMLRSGGSRPGACRWPVLRPDAPGFATTSMSLCLREAVNTFAEERWSSTSIRRMFEHGRGVGLRPAWW